MHIVETRTSFLARAGLHWHVQEHEAEEIVSSTCCPPSFVGCRRGEYIPEKQKEKIVFNFGLWTCFSQSNLTRQLGGVQYFCQGGFIPVLNRSNGNQGWLTFFPRNACTRTVTLLLHLLARAARGGKKSAYFPPLPHILPW